MQPIFASHKGRIARRLAYVVAGLAFVSFLLPGGAEEEVAARGGSQGGSISVYRVYPEGEEPSASDEETDDPSDGPTLSPEEMIQEDALDVAEDFIVQWATYNRTDQTPVLSSIPGAPQLPEHQEILQQRLDERVALIVDNNESSRGTVQSLSLDALEYDGGETQGVGSATITATSTSIVTNDQLGSGGTTVQIVYTIELRRTVEPGEVRDWYIHDVTETR